MAIPTKFAQANVELHKPDGMTDNECSSLHVHKCIIGGYQTAISRWTFTDEELAEIKETGSIWVYVWGWPPPPIAVAGTTPFPEENKQMDTKGNLYRSIEEGMSKGVPREELTEVDYKSLTKEQRLRWMNGEQPVVKPKDQKSKLAKIRDKHKRYLEKKRRMREGNKRALERQRRLRNA